MELPAELKKFIKEQTWIFAKTYADTWPHEYIVQEKVDNDLFLELSGHLDMHGYEDSFYEMKQIYFNYDGNTYWHMDNIINRCDSNETYRIRKKEGRLPKKLISAHTVIDGEMTDAPIHDISEEDDEHYRRVMRKVVGEERLNELERKHGFNE